MNATKEKIKDWLLKPKSKDDIDTLITFIFLSGLITWLLYIVILEVLKLGFYVSIKQIVMYVILPIAMIPIALVICVVLYLLINFTLRIMINLTINLYRLLKKMASSKTA